MYDKCYFKNQKENLENVPEYNDTHLESHY